MAHLKELHRMNTPPIVPPQEWEAARQQLLVKEKALSRDLTALGRQEEWEDAEGRRSWLSRRQTAAR